MENNFVVLKFVGLHTCWPTYNFRLDLLFVSGNFRFLRNITGVDTTFLKIHCAEQRMGINLHVKFNLLTEIQESVYVSRYTLIGFKVA